MQQHFIDTSINITMITELESTRGEKINYQKMLYTSRINSRQQLTKGWKGGKKTVALSGKKRKLTHVTERETDILAHTQVPHSVWENFVSCLFRKLGQQEKHICSSYVRIGKIKSDFTALEVVLYTWYCIEIFLCFLLQHTQICSSNGAWFIIRPSKCWVLTNYELQCTRRSDVNFADYFLNIF